MVADPRCLGPTLKNEKKKREDVTDDPKRAIFGDQQSVTTAAHHRVMMVNSTKADLRVFERFIPQLRLFASSH